MLTGGILLCALKDYTVGVGISTPASGVITDRIGGNDYISTLMVGSDTAYDSVIDPDSKVDLYFAGALGTGTVGAVVSYAAGSGKSETKDEDFDPAATAWSDISPYMENSASIIGLRLGYTMEELGPLASVDVAFGLEMPGFESVYNDPLASNDTSGSAVDKATCEKDGGMDMAIDVLGVKEMDDDTNVRIMLGYAKTALDTAQTEQIDDDDDGSYTTANSTDTNSKSLYKESGSTIGARLALNKTVNDDELLVVALGLVKTSSKIEESNEVYQDSTAVASRAATWEKQDLPALVYDEVETSGLAIPFAVGVEGNVLRDNITCRLGARKTLLETTKTTATKHDYEQLTTSGTPWGIESTQTIESTSKVDSNVTLGLGVGVELGNFTIDGYMEEDILFNGPYWVTGNASSFISKLDVTYAWE